jgi:hypothetical protein
MILRFTERTDRVAHVPGVLYHWRMHPASTAGSEIAKPYAFTAAQRAIRAHLDRIGVRARVDLGPPGTYRVVHEVDPATTIDVLIPTHDPDGLRATATSLRRQPHPTWQLTIPCPAREHPTIHHLLTGLGLRPDQFRTHDTDGDPPTRLAAAAQTSTAEHLLLTLTPFTALTHDWLTRLIGYASQPGIAAASPIILNPAGTILHAGIALPNGIPLYLLRAKAGAAWGSTSANVAALDGILVTRREVYAALAGLAPGTGALAFPEYCVRATRTGRRLVAVADSRVQSNRLHELNDLAGMIALDRSRRLRNEQDHLYNPGLRTDRGDYTQGVLLL